MGRYLVKITPLEPYSFGTDQGYGYPGEEKIGKISYFAKSETVPSQTTILGMLRYITLADRGLIKPSFEYSESDIERNNDAIGKESFSFVDREGNVRTEEQSFGNIKSVSPVFIMKGDKTYIKNPFNNNAKGQGYEPYVMSEKKIETSEGCMYLPENYDGKKGHSSGYICIEDKTLISKMFRTVVMSGNRKNNKNKDGEDGFFKREYVTFNEEENGTGFAFAVYVDDDKLPDKRIGYMGSKKSAFSIEAVEVDNTEGIETKVQDAFKDAPGRCYYALSDLYCEREISYSSFCIIEEKYQRVLTTNYSAAKYSQKISKSRNRVILVEAGSVFYEDVTDKFDNKNAGNIGYNSVVVLGGI